MLIEDVAEYGAFTQHSGEDFNYVLEGEMEFHTKDSADAAPEGFMPWFEVPGRRTEGTPVAFGHWSTLGLINRDDLLALDTGCLWGGHLTAARVDGATRELIQIACPQAQKPGKA